MIESLHNMIFYEKPEIVSSAPGKINLAGEHTDYNDGFIFAIAINRRVDVSISTRDDDTFVIYSAEFNSLVKFTKKDVGILEKNDWINPIKRIIFGLMNYGFEIPGANICVVNEIPRGIGLGSTVALCIAVAFGFKQLFNLEIEDIDLIRISQNADRKPFANSIASAMAQENAGILVDCRTLKFEYAPIPKSLKFLIFNAGKREENAVREYMNRVKECKEALELISSLNPQVNSLRDIIPDELNRYSTILDQRAMKRVRHVVTENERTLNLVVALRRRDFTLVGKILFDSHFSLRNNYEVSSDELDAIVDISATVDGVFGAKLIGIGFGGGAVSVVRKEKAGEAIRIVSEEFKKRTGKNLKVYVTSPERGLVTSFRG